MKPDLKRLGKKQKEVIKRMANEDLFIKEVHDLRDGSIVRSLSDEDNDYEDLSHNFIDSLGKRKIFNCLDWLPCLEINIMKFTLKDSAIKKAKELKII